jgi:hypothetical protein
MDAAQIFSDISELSTPRPNGSRALERTVDAVKSWLEDKSIRVQAQSFLLRPFFMELLGLWLALAGLLLVVAALGRWRWMGLVLALMTVAVPVLEIRLLVPVVSAMVRLPNNRDLNLALSGAVRAVTGKPAVQAPRISSDAFAFLRQGVMATTLGSLDAELEDGGLHSAKDKPSRVDPQQLTRTVEVLSHFLADLDAIKGKAQNRAWARLGQTTVSGKAAWDRFRASRQVGILDHRDGSRSR